MKQVKQLLVEGHAQASRERFASLIAEHPEKARPAAELMIKVLEDCCDLGLSPAVNEWLRDVEATLPAKAADPILRAMRERMLTARQWSEFLEGVTRERLARECRRWIVLGRLEDSAGCAARLLDRSRSPEQLDQNARYLAHALSEMHRDLEKARHVIEKIPSLGGEQAAQGAKRLSYYFAQAARERVDRDYDQGERAWMAQLTESILRLRESLPGDNEVGEPTNDQFQRFLAQSHAVMTAGLAQGRMDDLIDALQILIDFCPIDESAIKNIAGVEDRIFLRLGPRARLTTVRVMRQLGRQDVTRQAILRLAESREGKDRVKLLAGVMGGLGHGDFFPWLSRLLRKTTDKMEEAWLVDAISRLDHPDAGETLLERLALAIHNLGQQGGLARARQALTALGRYSRQRGIDVLLRNEVIRRATELTDRAERELGFQAASMLFSNRPDEIDPELKEWAARKCVEAMWSQPSRVEDMEPASVNGWRQPMVATLARLGSEALPMVLKTADKFKARYSGAMGALGNALEVIGDASAVPLMQTMIQCALTHEDEGQRSRLLDEKVRDAATGQIRDLDRDEMVHGLLYSMMHFGGEDGMQAALEYADQLQAGLVTAPGPKTTALLFDVKLKHGKIGALSARVSAATMVDAKDLRAALADARGGLFSRKGKRIAAMALLGQSRVPEAVPILIEALGDKDVLISSAAHTALGRYMMPPPNETAFRVFWEAVLERPKLLKGQVLEKLIDFIRLQVPKNPPYNAIYAQQVEAMIEDGALMHCLRGAIARAHAAKPVDEVANVFDAGQPSAPPQPGAAAHQGPRSDLDRRREYMQARRNWLESGKKGPPPQPPAQRAGH
jgi:hypothetical protein